jgi:hypothetical protein
MRIEWNLAAVTNRFGFVEESLVDEVVFDLRERVVDWPKRIWHDGFGEIEACAFVEPFPIAGQLEIKSPPKVVFEQRVNAFDVALDVRPLVEFAEHLEVVAIVRLVHVLLDEHVVLVEDLVQPLVPRQSRHFVHVFVPQTPLHLYVGTTDKVAVGWSVVTEWLRDHQMRNKQRDPLEHLHAAIQLNSMLLCISRGFESWGGSKEISLFTIRSLNFSTTWLHSSNSTSSSPPENRSPSTQKNENRFEIIHSGELWRSITWFGAANRS